MPMRISSCRASCDRMQVSASLIGVVFRYGAGPLMRGALSRALTGAHAASTMSRKMQVGRHMSRSTRLP